MILCNELNKSFATYDELFKELVANKDKIISLKKAEVKWSKGVRVAPLKDEEAYKSSIPDMEDGYIYPIINTTKILDGHRDLHIDGLWNKTIKEQKGRIHYTTNHELKIGSIIAYPQDVTPYTVKIKWSAIGKSLTGSTEALVFKVKLQDYANQDAKKAIESKLPVQNSVSMIYKKIILAVNSEDEEYKEEKAAFDTYFDKIANKEEWPELKYFWVVKEAMISREGSMVPEGSNKETPIIYPKSISEPLKDTHEEQPEEADKQSLSEENLSFIHALGIIINNN